MQILKGGGMVVGNGVVVWEGKHVNAKSQELFLVQIRDEYRTR